MSRTVFVARQPIFDRGRIVTGYELLFRSGPENFFSHSDHDYASSQVIHDSLHVFGLDALLAGKQVFVNTTREVLLRDRIRLLPPKSTVVELLETVAPEPEVIAACESLKKDGYVIALDDFIFQPGYEELLKIADIVKVDFIITQGDERRRILEKILPYGARALAEKVETQEDVRQALSLGYELFQGYFFCRPEMISSKDIPGFKLNYLRLLQALAEPELDFSLLEKIIKQEVSLSVKFLRYLNSAQFGWYKKVDSIKQALVILGEKPFRKWASLVALIGLGNDKPAELVVTSLIRARFCEQLGAKMRLPERDIDLFLTGMLSLVGAMVGRPIEEVLERLSVAVEVHAAIVKNEGRLGRILAMVTAYEGGDWEQMSSIVKELGATDDVIPESYREAVVWAERVFAV